MTASTAPYRFSALWLITLSRNSTSISGPSGPVACLTASIVSAPAGTASTATAPKMNASVEPIVQPR